MVQTPLEIEIAKVQKAQLDLKVTEEKLLKQFKEELLKNRAIDKIIARALKILKENDVTRNQLLAVLDNDSVYGDSKVKARSDVEASGVDDDVEVEVKAPRAPIGDGDKRRVVLPKYQNPLNPEEKWTGRGRPPHWAQNFVINKTLETILIPKTSSM